MKYESDIGVALRVIANPLEENTVEIASGRHLERHAGYNSANDGIFTTTLTERSFCET